MPRLIPRLIPKSSPVTMSHFMAAPSVHERRAELFEPLVVIDELLDPPLGAVMQNGHGVKENAVGVACALRGVEEQVQLSVPRKTPTRALHGVAILLKDPRPLLGRGPVQKRGQVVAERSRSDVVPVDESGPRAVTRQPDEDVLRPEVAVQERIGS